MARRYTYDQFQKAAQDSGLWGQFSQADLSRAAESPDFGMSILNYKKDYRDAATDEARALANQGAEALRKSWGSYTGGENGGSFYLDPMSPGSFEAGKAPSYTSPYGSDIADLWAKQNGYGPYEYSGGAAPEYSNRYDKTIQDMITGMLERPDFSYDPATDPLYQNYRKQYTREGDRATADALGAAAAASGGIPSSYASTAAGQAANYYAAQMTDKIPELYELAYNQYLNDFNMDLSKLGAVQGAEQSDYDKHLNQLNQYNTDRSFDYSAWRDQYNLGKDQLQTAMGLEELAYNQYLNELNQFNKDRDFGYGQFLDEIDSQTLERNEAREDAYKRAELANDYGGLADMGWDVSNNPFVMGQNQQLQSLARAEVDGILASGGTPSAELLRDSGYSSEYIQAMRGAYQRQAAQGSGSGRRSAGSGGSSGGSGGTEQDYDGLFAAAQASDHPKSFIANNYKRFGFTSSSGLYDDYESWNEGSDEAELDATPSSAPNGYRNTSAQLSTMEQRTQERFVPEDALKIIQSAYEGGRITEAEAKELASRYGITL